MAAKRAIGYQIPKPIADLIDGVLTSLGATGDTTAIPRKLQALAATAAARL